MIIEQPWTDKIDICKSYIEKRNLLAQQFYQIISEINLKRYTKQDAQDMELFAWACQNLAELYGTVLRRQYTKVLSKSEFEEIERIHGDYVNKGGINLEQLKRGFELITAIMSLNKFDDVLKYSYQSDGVRTLKDKYSAQGGINDGADY